MRSVVTETPGGSAECRRDGLGLLAILVVAAAVRAVAWSNTVVLFNDGPVFLGMARAIEAGRWAEVLAHPFHPLYPALIALVARVPMDFEDAAIVVSIAGGLMSVLGIFLFVRRAFDRDLAWLAAWIVALHPWAVDFSSDVMSDGLYAGLYLLGFAALAATIEKPRLSRALGCGLAAGLAYLVRPEGVGLLVACALLLLVRASVNKADRKRTLVAMAGLFLVAGLVMAPLVGSITEQSGQWSLTRKKSLGALITGKAEIQLEAHRGAAAIGLGQAQPIALPRSSERAGGGGAFRPTRTVAGLADASLQVARTSLAALRYEVALFAVAGVWLIRSRRRSMREATVALPVFLYSGLLVLLFWGAGYVARRHALAPLLPICAYAAIGWRALCVEFIDRFAGGNVERAGRLKSPTAICLLLVVVLVGIWGARDLRVRRLEREPVRLAAEWLRDHGVGDVSVAAQKLRVAYYSGADYVPLPSGNDGEIEKFLRRCGAGWVVIDEARLQDHRGLAAGLGDWLLPIHSVERAGLNALVLELR